MNEFRYKNIDEYVSNELTPEERKTHSKLIEECKKRELRNKENSESLKKNLGKLCENIEVYSKITPIIDNIVTITGKAINNLTEVAKYLHNQSKISKAYQEKKGKISH